MVSWTGLKRSTDIILAVWPYYQPSNDKWYMHELVERDNKPPLWRLRLVPGDNDSVFADHYEDQATAFAGAETLNIDLKEILAARDIEPEIKLSLQLKTDKALQAKKRLADEENLMLKEAIRRHQNTPRHDVNSLKISRESEPYRQALSERLNMMPYLKVARVRITNNRWEQVILYKNTDDSWSKPYAAGDRAAIASERAKIANGFGFSSTEHWGKTKAAIREILLPRANQLLQLASVQRLLAEALARGEHVLVSNGIVFWYEQNGTSIGWQVKITSTIREGEGATIWNEGTIQSVNHGRLVILPYLKENGEKVKGHTKNAPHDGKALPRHPDHFVDIPFSQYDGDLMIGLFGELPYE